MEISTIESQLNVRWKRSAWIHESFDFVRMKGTLLNVRLNLSTTESIRTSCYVKACNKILFINRICLELWIDTSNRAMTLRQAYLSYDCLSYYNNSVLASMRKSGKCSKEMCSIHINCIIHSTNYRINKHGNPTWLLNSFFQHLTLILINL